MSEPTKEQIAEAIRISGMFDDLSAPPEVCVARCFAHIRTQATNDALERAAVLLDNTNTVMLDMYAKAIRAMKVPT